MVPLLNK